MCQFGPFGGFPHYCASLLYFLPLSSPDFLLKVDWSCSAGNKTISISGDEYSKIINVNSKFKKHLIISSMIGQTNMSADVFAPFTDLTQLLLM